MPGLVEFPAGNATILIAVSGEPDVMAVAKIDDQINRVAESLSSKLDVIRRLADDLAVVIDKASSRIEKAEIEFGLSATGKGTLYVVETSVEASFKVKLTIAAASKVPCEKTK